MQSHISCIFVISSIVCFHTCSQIACLNRCKVSIVADVQNFSIKISNTCFNRCKVTIVACVSFSQMWIFTCALTLVAYLSFLRLCVFTQMWVLSAFHSRSLTTTQETKEFMARSEVPRRLQIDKPDQRRGHNRQPHTTSPKKKLVLTAKNWESVGRCSVIREAFHVDYVICKQLRNWDYP